MAWSRDGAIRFARVDPTIGGDRVVSGPVSLRDGRFTEGAVATDGLGRFAVGSMHDHLDRDVADDLYAFFGPMGCF